MVSDGHSKHEHGKLRWPEITSANTIPTPYQIFNQRKGTPYSKDRFYELVKLYHPDRHDFATFEEGLSYATKLERYRLIVAANDILSDPVKRSAYDTYGAGWNGQPDVLDFRDKSPSGVRYGRRGWGSEPGGPSHNATWEDWERWYQREERTGGPQEPRFVSNTAFVGLIVMFAVIGGIAQATRLGNYSLNFMEQTDALHDNMSKYLMQARREAKNFDGTRDERIHEFLKQRYPTSFASSARNDGEYRRLMTQAEDRLREEVKNRPRVLRDRQQSNPKDG